MSRDEREFADRFDDYLDALVGGHPIAAPDPTLGQTARRVHALDRRPRPNAAFVARLEEELMGTAHRQIAGTATPAPNGITRPPAHWWRPSFVSRGAAPRHRNTPALIATALVLLLTLVATYGTTRLLPMHDGSQPGMIPSAAGTPATPAAKTCPLPLPSAAPLLAHNGTPVPPTTKTILPLPNPPQPLGFVTEKQPFPSGTPTDAATVAAITAAVHEWQACVNAPMASGATMPPGLAMFSDNYFRRMAPGAAAWYRNSGQGQPTAWWQVYRPWGFRPGVFPTISDVRQLPDGRVGAIISKVTEYPYVVVFVHQDRHWLIDELALYSPGGTPVAGQPPVPPAATPSASQGITIVMADFVFRPSTTTIPANTPVTITLVNKGRVPHSFVIDALHVRIELKSGGRGQVVLDIPPGSYEFYSDIPGQKKAGMTGHLTVTAGGTPVPTP